MALNLEELRRAARSGLLRSPPPSLLGEQSPPEQRQRQPQPRPEVRDRPGPTWVTWFWLAVFGVFFLRSCDFLDNDAKTNIADGGPAQSYEQLAGSAADETVPQPANEPDIPILADLPSVQTSSDLYVVISNNTGYPIQQVFISPDDASSWEEDRLEGRILNHGESIRFNLTGHRNPMFDIQLVDADGDTYSFHDVDVERYDVTATIANLDP